MGISINATLDAELKHGETTLEFEAVYSSGGSAFFGSDEPPWHEVEIVSCYDSEGVQLAVEKLPEEVVSRAEELLLEVGYDEAL